MKLSRRSLLKAGLGSTQIGLLAKFGFWGKGARAAPGDGPDRLLTLYVPGGWMPVYAFCPLSGPQISRVIPGNSIFQNERVFYTPSQVSNLDGTGDGSSSGFSKLRMPRQWNEPALSAGMPDPRTGGSTPNGWAWVYHRLWENASVVHGVDARTAAHLAGTISAFCGVPGDEFHSPSLHAYAAHFLYDTFSRPLPNVTIDSIPTEALALRPEVAPVEMNSAASAQYNFSERVEQAWSGLRNRTVKPQTSFTGSALTPFASNPIEDYVGKKLRALGRTTTRGTDAFYQKLYDAYQNVSKQLANDVVSRIEATRGVENTPHPYWIPPGASHFATDIGGGFTVDNGNTWNNTFDLALRVLKADVATAVSVNCPALGGRSFDTHTEGNLFHFVHLRAVSDVIGRLLGEMKATILPSGRSLLDKTLVVVFSEFARTWPRSNTSDHWPATSVVFAGGGVSPNRMIGGYDVDADAPDAVGFNGLRVDVRENNQVVSRQPNSADVVHTALKIMGLSDGDIFIPGGSGEIAGIRG